MKATGAVVNVHDFCVTFNPCCCPGSVPHRHQWNSRTAEPRETLLRVSRLLKPLSGNGRGEERLGQGALTGVCVCVLELFMDCECYKNNVTFQYQSLMLYLYRSVNTGLKCSCISSLSKK